MKAMEDKIKAVIAECERICPNEKDKHLFDWGIVYNHGTHWTLRNRVAGGCLHSTDASHPYATEKNWDLAYSLLSLGVQSPAPDENGRIPMLNWEGDSNVSTASFWGTTFKVTQLKDSDYSAQVLGYGKCHLGYFGVIGDAKDRCEDYFAKMFSSILKLPDTRAHAPIAGKDRTNEAIRVCADFAEAVVSSLKEKHRSLKSKHEREVSRLIEALEWVSREIGEPDHPNSYTIEKVLQGIEDALAAYKGKEGGEG